LHHQVKDVLFQPVRKAQDAMFFFKTPDGLWMPCGPKQPGAIQITMTELASKGLASQVLTSTHKYNKFLIPAIFSVQHFFYWFIILRQKI
jgi:Vps4 C terminal oligomerisation domain